MLLANLVFLPIAGKLRKRSDEEVLYRQTRWRGLSIQADENRVSLKRTGGFSTAAKTVEEPPVHRGRGGWFGYPDGEIKCLAAIDAGGEESKGGASWLTTYGDMVTLPSNLLRLLYSFSTVDARSL